ncbi:Protein CLEC16A, partial [Trichinella patagoniensis]
LCCLYIPILFKGIFFISGQIQIESMPKGKLFSTGGLWKPKNQHSLEYLKYLCDLLTKNAIVTEQNRALLVEALRLISEILIWGDQNDSSVFDFFLEKNMLSFFLFIMRQKCGRFVCIQLLQTLNILFENIRNETSLYYLLSNNHVNSIITYRFDFSDEEILAYYISFLKTLSFKLNANTVHFFFNEHTLDFPLYTEAIKFFNHAESMVRIAVRTLTLNICIRKYLHVCVLVNDPQVIRFIRDNTAVPYFSNLVWFIRQRANEINGSGVDRMRDLIADHQDHIHYLNDILCLDVEDLNKVLIDQLMSKLFLPVYLNSIYAIPDINDERPFSLLVTVFFLTQLFVIISYSTLVERMARILLLNGPKVLRRKQIPKAETAPTNGVCDFSDEAAELAPVVDNCADQSVDDDRTFASIIFSSLENAENDQIAYFVLCLMLAIGENEGISPAVMECTQISSPVDRESKSGSCSVGNYATPILQLILRSHDEDCPVRIATLELCCSYITQLFHSSKMHSRVILEMIPRLKHCRHLIEQKLIPCIEAFDTFIELFEDEATAFMNSTFNLARSCSKELFLISPSLIPPTVDYTNRPTCTEYERVRRLLRSWFILSKLLTNLRAESLELEKTMQPVLSVKEGDCMNLGKFFFLLTRSNSDLLACTVIHDDNNRCHQFLVVGNAQLYFVEPDSSKVGWGVVRFVGQLQSCEVRTEKDNRALLLMVHSAKSRLNTTKSPLFAAKLLFDDHIRCMAAKQRLTKGCSQSRKYRLVAICDLLHVKVPEPAGPLPSRVFHNLTTGKANQMLPGFVVVHGSSGNPGNETVSPVAPGPSRPFSPKRRSRLAKFTGSKVELSPTNSSNEEPKKQDDIDGVVEEMRCIDLGQSPKPAKLLFSQKFNTTIANAAEVTEYCQEQPGSSSSCTTGRTMDTETAGETESTEKAANNENTVAAPLPDHLKPTCMIVLGMAGSGKSTLVQRICAYLSATKTSLYPVNLDPAVHYVSYPTAVDIRESVNYKEIMQKYGLGPNGGIMTAMNIFATTFGKVIDFLENSSINYKYAVFDTPGQIEVFTWSASGAIISQALASSFPTVIVYVMDVARSSSPITFTSNMLYACSIMYKTQLPMVVAMNKTDIISANFALDWINDFECFLEALDSETSFAGDLTRRLALGLEEFYKTLKCTGVSAISGEGMKRFFELIDQARLEYETDYKPELEQRKLQLDKKKIEKQAERLNRLKLDIASDPPQSHIASLRENFFGDQFCFGGLQDDDSAEDEEYEKPSSSGVEPIPRPSAPDRASSRWFPFVYGDKTEMRGETSDDSYSSSVGSALLVLVCWTIGRSDCSIFWMLALLGLVLLRNHLLRQRSRRIRAHQVTALQEKEVIVTQLKDLPTWVQFPDVERVEWINRAFEFDLTGAGELGVVRVGVIAATNLENKDSFLKGKSDPYVRITVGGQIYQTKTIENNLNPVWNEEFDAIVDHADGQYLGVELYDEDPGSRDEFLGNLDLDMDSVRNKGYISDWYALNAVKHGNVNLSVHWMNLSSDASLLDDVQNLPHSVPSSGPRNHALLMIYVDCIKNLPVNCFVHPNFMFTLFVVDMSCRLPPLPTTRDLVRIYRLSANKKLSQNFLLDMNLTRKLVRTAGNLEGNYVCEVGPGPGGITRAILEQNPKKLVVVEKDPRFLPTLELIAESTGGIMDIRIGDVMKYEIETEFPADVKREWSEEPPPVHVIGNLPFNVSTYLIIKWLRAMSLHEGPFAYGRTLLTLTFQKEVGERMLAPIFNRHRCRLSVMCQYLSDVKRKFTIPGRACVPSPDVDVAVMQFRPKVTPVISHHFDLVEKFCRHVFHYRNKYCIRGIETLFPDFLKKDFSHEILRFARVSPKLAPPALAIEEIRDMCRIYEEQCLRVPSLFYYDYRQRKDFEEVQRNCPAEPPLLKHLSSNVETFSERL